MDSFESNNFENKLEHIVDCSLNIFDKGMYGLTGIFGCLAVYEFSRATYEIGATGKLGITTYSAIIAPVALTRFCRTMSQWCSDFRIKSGGDIKD